MEFLSLWRSFNIHTQPWIHSTDECYQKHLIMHFIQTCWHFGRRTGIIRRGYTIQSIGWKSLRKAMPMFVSKKCTINNAAHPSDIVIICGKSIIMGIPKYYVSLVVIFFTQSGNTERECSFYSLPPNTHLHTRLLPSSAPAVKLGVKRLAQGHLNDVMRVGSCSLTLPHRARPDACPPVHTDVDVE